MSRSMQSLAQQVQLDRRAICYALGSFAAIVVMLKQTLFRGSKAGTKPAATKTTVKDAIAELVSEPEPAESPTHDSSAEVETMPSAADALSVLEHPAVKKADKRMHKSRLLRKMDEDVKELMREVVYLRAVAEA